MNRSELRWLEACVLVHPMAKNWCEKAPFNLECWNARDREDIVHRVRKLRQVADALRVAEGVPRTGRTVVHGTRCRTSLSNCIKITQQA